MVKPINYAGQTAEELFGRRSENATDAEDAVKAIIRDVRERGDAAVRDYSLKFDGWQSEQFEVQPKEFDEALAAISDEYIKVLQTSIANITAFHKKQLRKGFEITENGCTVGQKVTAVNCAAIYVPGGTAAYPSTVLMNAIPAKIAGVKNIVMATPVKADGKIRPEVLAAAKLCGVDRVFKMGGAQAIAALAYGTESVPRADKITGPGNIFVATAKKLVFGECGIDMIAGPSEILIIADGGANAECVAADMLSQAEHDRNAAALLITDSADLATAVCTALRRQVKLLPRREIAEASLYSNGRIIVVEDISIAVAISDSYAPEHLELCVKDPFALLEKVNNAGSVFLGYSTPEAVGDYYSGANHTLPTGGTARFFSPLSVEDFVKTTQYIYYTPDALENAADCIDVFARSEGLDAHAESVAIRRNK